MISIRGGSGLGDALYVQAIARHLAARGQRVEACSDWPDVFRTLGEAVRVVPFRRDRVDLVAHYSLRRHLAGTDQFTDCCIQAGLREPVDLRLDWRPGGALVEATLAHGLPILLVQMPREPMARGDGYALELLPDCRRLQQMIDAVGDRMLVVQVGKGIPLWRLRVHVDLANGTSLPELLGLAAAAAGFLGYCSFMAPLAESFAAPALFLWSRRGLGSADELIRRLTPTKVLHRAFPARGGTSRWIVDDCDDTALARVVDALVDAGRGPAAV